VIPGAPRVCISVRFCALKVVRSLLLCVGTRDLGHCPHYDGQAGLAKHVCPGAVTHAWPQPVRTARYRGCLHDNLKTQGSVNGIQWIAVKVVFQTALTMRSMRSMRSHALQDSGFKRSWRA
jgi:hypothetical protein